MEIATLLTSLGTMLLSWGHYSYRASQPMSMQRAHRMKDIPFAQSQWLKDRIEVQAKFDNNVPKLDMVYLDQLIAFAHDRKIKARTPGANMNITGNARDQHSKSEKAKKRDEKQKLNAVVVTSIHGIVRNLRQIYGSKMLNKDAKKSSTVHKKVLNLLAGVKGFLGRLNKKPARSSSSSQQRDSQQS